MQEYSEAMAAQWLSQASWQHAGRRAHTADWHSDTSQPGPAWIEQQVLGTSVRSCGLYVPWATRISVIPCAGSAAQARASWSQWYAVAQEAPSPPAGASSST